MKKSIKTKIKPNLHRRLFWDERYDDTDWQEGARGIIERVLVWGDDEEYEEIIRCYGRERIVHALTKEYVYLPNYVMDRVAGYFGILKEEFTIWKRKQHKVQVWI
jgi:hypothetical protein